MKKTMMDFKLLTQYLLLSLLVLGVGCASDEKAASSTLPNDSTEEDQTSGEGTDADTEEETGEETANKEADKSDKGKMSAQAEDESKKAEVCLAEGETVDSLALKTDLFTKGMKISFAGGGVEFNVVDSSYALVLSDDYTVTEFSADGEDATKLVAEGDKKTAAKDVAAFKFHLNADFELTVSDLKKYFAEEGFNLDSDEAHKAVFSYEFAKLFENTKGKFKFHVNDKVFYASEDKSKLSFEFGESWSSVTENAELAEKTETTEEESTDSTAEEGEEDTESTESSEEETAEESEETSSDEAEETAEGGTEEETTEETAEEAKEDSDVKFQFSVTVFYEVSAEELAGNEYFKKFSTACETTATEEEGTEATEEESTSEEGASESEDSTDEEGEEGSTTDEESTEEGTASEGGESSEEENTEDTEDTEDTEEAEEGDSEEGASEDSEE